MQTIKKSANKTLSQTANKIVNVNLDSFAKRLSTITGSNTKTKDSIYVYPDDFTSIDISSKKGKSFRDKRRKQFEQIVNAFLHLQKQKELKTISAQIFADSAKEIVSLFADTYKEYYRANDYSFASVSQSNNEGKKTEILSFLSFCKNANANVVTPAKKKNNVIPAKKDNKAKTSKETPIVSVIAD